MDPVAPDHYSRRLFWTGAALLVIIVGGYFYFYHGGGGSIPAPTGSFELMSNAGAARYSFSGTEIVRAAASASTTILASGTAATSFGTPVLAHLGNSAGDIVGLLSGTSVTPIVVDDQPKEGIASRPDGYVAFGEVTTTKSGTQVTIEIANVSNGHADPKLRSAGIGYPLATLGNGTFLVATPTGLEALDPLSLTMSSVIADGSAVAAATPSGDRVASVNATSGLVDVFALNPTTGRATYQYSVHGDAGNPVRALGFIGSNYLFVQISPASVALHYVPVGPSAAPILLGSTLSLPPTP